MSLFRTLLALLALTLTPAFAQSDSLELPEGTVELTDILSPEEIAAELLNEEFGLVDGMPTAANETRLYVLVDKSEQRLWVYEDGTLTGSWLVSAGTEKQKCAPSKCYRASTPVGIFTPYRMHFNYTSKLWNARMDRAIFIVGGIALHATYGENIALLGTRASGGCVRQHPDNADRLFKLVKYYGAAFTKVQIQE